MTRARGVSGTQGVILNEKEYKYIKPTTTMAAPSYHLSAIIKTTITLYPSNSFLLWHPPNSTADASTTSSASSSSAEWRRLHPPFRLSPGNVFEFIQQVVATTNLRKQSGKTVMQILKVGGQELPIGLN